MPFYYSLHLRLHFSFSLKDRRCRNPQYLCRAVPVIVKIMALRTIHIKRLMRLHFILLATAHDRNISLQYIAKFLSVIRRLYMALFMRIERHKDRLHLVLLCIRNNPLYLIIFFLVYEEIIRPEYDLLFFLFMKEFRQIASKCFQNILQCRNTRCR